MVLRSVADNELGQSHASSPCAARAVKVFTANDLSSFTGPDEQAGSYFKLSKCTYSGILVVNGDVVGDLVETDGMHEMAVYVEDDTGFTAVCMRIRDFSDDFKEKLEVGVGVRVTGLLQLLPGTQTVLWFCGPARN